MTSAAMRLSSDSDRKPWAMVPPKPAAAAAVRIDVDELMVLGRVGEFADPVLADLDPVGNADRLADFRADFVEGGDGHRPLS